MKNYFLDRINEKKQKQKREAITNEKLEQAVRNYICGDARELPGMLRQIISTNLDYFENTYSVKTGLKDRPQIEKDCLRLCLDKTYRFNGVKAVKAFNYFTTIILSHARAIRHAQKRDLFYDAKGITILERAT